MDRRLVTSLTLAVAAALTVALATTASATREVVEVGNLFLVDNGGIFPSKLPRHESAPVSARLEGEIGTRDGSHPPALRTIDLDVDRTIEVDALGLPVCKAGQITARSLHVAPGAVLRAKITIGPTRGEGLQRPPSLIAATGT